MGQHWKFVICDWLNLICHMYLCRLAEHRGWGLPLACLCKRARKIYILHVYIEHHYAGLLRMCEHWSLPGVLFFNLEKHSIKFIKTTTGILYLHHLWCMTLFQRALHGRRMKEKTVSMLCNHSAQKWSGCQVVRSSVFLQRLLQKLHFAGQACTCALHSVYFHLDSYSYWNTWNYISDLVQTSAGWVKDFLPLYSACI